MLSDIDIVQKKLEKGKRKLLKSKEILTLEKKLKSLNSGLETLDIFEEDENKFLSQLGLLSVKPKIIVCNVDEKSLSNGNKYTESVKKI